MASFSYKKLRTDKEPEDKSKDDDMRATWKDSTKSVRKHNETSIISEEGREMLTEDARCRSFGSPTEL